MSITKHRTSAQRSTVHLLTSPLLTDLPWLVHGFSTRSGGVSTAYNRACDLNLGHTPEDTADHVRENERRFLAALGEGRALELLRIHQIHSTIVWRDPERTASGDGLFTTQPGRALSVRTADCVPILLADTRLRAVAAVHAGWRGTVERIVEKSVGELRAQLSSDPAHLRAVIGPSIRGCCYTVGAEVVEAFQARFPYAADLFSATEPNPVHQRFPRLFPDGVPGDHSKHAARLDLAEANRRQLLAAGLRAENIDVLPYCTACRADLFFSHRRDAGHTGRMAAAIAIIVT
jgi:YfiH family protein